MAQLVMGDLVLTETEVNPVMGKLLANGIEVTALHNHLLRATPATFYMHVHGHGDPVSMATAIHDALAESKTPFERCHSASVVETAPIDLDTDKLDAASARRAKSTGGVYQFSVPRAGRRSARMACRFHQPWVPPSLSTSNPQEMGRPRSPATSSSRRRRSGSADPQPCMTIASR